MTDTFLLYGANGFVGEVIVRLAVERGLKPILAGRNEDRVKALAAELGLPCRVFALEDSVAMDAALHEVPFVLHCAGPYVHTAKQMVDGCLRTGTHYLDLSGGIIDFQALIAREAEAQAKGVMLLPGTGFDVVPTDCLALHLKERLPSATLLRLAWKVQGPNRVPPGTLATMLDTASRRGPGAIVRRNGELTSVPAAQRMIDFGQGPVKATLSFWGDVFTSYYSTGIPNVEEYIGWSDEQLAGMKAIGMLRPWLRFSLVRNYLRSRAPTGPSVQDRAETRTLVWGEVEDGQGRSAVSRLTGPEGGVTWTSLTALDAVKQVMAGHVRPGFQTPAKMFGADFGLQTEGVTLVDVA